MVAACTVGILFRQADCVHQTGIVMPLLFASQTAPGGPAVILPALLIAGLLVALSQAFVPKGDQ
jgi:hypothetical protein